MHQIDIITVCCFLFHLDGVDKTQLLNGSIRYVTIVSKGELSLFFGVIESNNNTTTGNNSNGQKFVEPKISWAKSRARKLLYTDVKQEKIRLDARVNGKRTTNNNVLYNCTVENNAQIQPNNYFLM